MTKGDHESSEKEIGNIRHETKTTRSTPKGS